jgi:hypothetical protein
MKETIEYIRRKDFYYEVIRKNGRLISIFFRYNNEISIGHNKNGKVFFFEQFLPEEIFEDICKTISEIKCLQRQMDEL